MNPGNDSTLEKTVVDVYLRACQNQLDEGLTTIDHCLRQLNDQQLWWRPANEMNSIANLMLHLCGNLRQWLISGLSGEADYRRRQQEFDDRSGRSREELFQALKATIEEAQTQLQSQNAESLLRIRHVQQFDIDGFQTSFDSICHFRGHVQEIVHITRCLCGQSYQFLFVPKNPD